MKNLTNEKEITKKLNLIFCKIDFNSTPKMGGVKKLTCKNISVEEDGREFYSGRGEKYNKNINHSFQEIEITQKLMNDLVREEKLKLKKRKLVEIADKKASCYGSLQNLFVKTNNYYVHHSYGKPLQLIFNKNKNVVCLDFSKLIRKFCVKKGIKFINIESGLEMMKSYNLDPNLLSGGLFANKEFRNKV